MTFEIFAQMFLDFEKEFIATQEGSNAFSIEIQREEFNSLWTKVKDAYEAFVTGDEENSKGDRNAARELFGHYRLGYVNVAALMSLLYQTCVSRSDISSKNSRINENRFRDQMQLPACTMEVFRGDYKYWPFVRDMFIAVYVDGANISPVEQLFYLRQFSRGDALEIVKKSPLTTHRFQEAWNNLRDSF